MNHLQLNQSVIKELLFGTLDAEKILIGFIFAMFGMLINALLHSITEQQMSPDNYVRTKWKKWMASILVIALLMRFSMELTGKEFTMYMGAFYGFTVDIIILYAPEIKKRAAAKIREILKIPDNTNSSPPQNQPPAAE